MTESIMDALSRMSGPTIAPEARVLGLCLANGLAAGSLRLRPEHFADPKLRAVFELMWRNGRAIQPDEIDNYRAKTDEISKQLVELYEKAGGRITTEAPKDEIARLAQQLRGETSPPAPPTQPTLKPEDVNLIEWAKGTIGYPFFMVADACELQWNVKLANAGEVIRFMVRERLLGPGQVAVQFKQYLHTAASSGSFAPPSPPPTSHFDQQRVEPDPGWDQGPPAELEREPDLEAAYGYEPPDPPPTAKKAKSAKKATRAAKKPNPAKQPRQIRISPDADVLAGNETLQWYRKVPRIAGFTQGERTILWAIASHINRNTGTAWPALATIAKLAGSDKRTVISALDHAIEAGVLAVISGGGRRSNTYRLALPRALITRKNAETEGAQMEGGDPSASASSTSSRAPRATGRTLPSSSPIPSDWQPDRATQRLAIKRLGEDRAQAEEDKFRTHYLATGATRKDWNAAFRKWILNDFQAGRSSR